MRIIATGPSGFPGASQIMCGWLLGLSDKNVDIHLITSRPVFSLESISYHKIACHLVTPLVSNALGEQGAVGNVERLAIGAIAEKICKIAKLTHTSDRNLVIWGTYIFPYGLAAYLATISLINAGINCKLWITPTGSDVWELCPQLENLASTVMNTEIANVFTYSDSFADEVQRQLGLSKTPTVIRPLLNLRKFHRLTENEKAAKRGQLGFNASTFIITHHSNMRPIKRPDKVIELARMIADSIYPKEVQLIIMGPVLSELSRMSLDPLKVRWTGVIHDVETYLQISDLEINLSSHDSFNLSLAEAMACGVPVVSTSVVGIAPYIRRSRCGYLFSATDNALFCQEQLPYQKIVKAIVKLALSSELQKRMSDNAVKQAKRLFTSVEFIDRLISLG